MKALSAGRAKKRGKKLPPSDFRKAVAEAKVLEARVLELKKARAAGMKSKYRGVSFEERSGKWRAEFEGEFVSTRSTEVGAARSVDKANVKANG
jgi:hypothetical protein